MSKPSYKDRKKKTPHDWRPFITITGEQVGPFSKNVYALATISKDDFRKMKGPPGAILYGEDGNSFRIAFLKSELDSLEAGLDTPDI